MRDQYIGEDCESAGVGGPDAEEGCERGPCGTLFQCFFTHFDQGFKNDGGIGGFLLPNENSQGRSWGIRMLFDNLYVTMPCLYIIHLMYGMYAINT